MKIKYTIGCVFDRIDIDGEELSELTEEKKQEVTDKVCQYIRQNPDILRDVLTRILIEKGEYEQSEQPCDTCGDYINTYSLEI